MNPMNDAWNLLKAKQYDCEDYSHKEGWSYCGRPDCASCGGYKELEKAQKRDPRLARAGVSGFNKPKRTPNHPKKSHIVVARSGGKTKTIRFGEQGASVAGKPKAGESQRMKNKRKSFKSRHAKNIARGPMSAAYWADKVKW
jgi:hypothetical protein